MKFNLFSILLIFFFTSCSSVFENSKTKIDLEQIRRRGKLTVLIQNSSLSFYEQRGEKLGFEFEIIQAFAKSIKLPLEIKVVNNSSDMLRLLSKGEGDIVSANLPVSISNAQKINFSIPYYYSEQVLVQREDNKLIKTPLDIGKKCIYVTKNSPYEKRLIALQDEVGANINIRTFDDDPITEELIEKVARKEIDFTIAHQNMAYLSKKLNPNLDYNLAISVKQKIAFALRKNSPELKKVLDIFLSNYCKSNKFLELKNKYFDLQDKRPIVYDTFPKDNLSPYDELFKNAAKPYGWDWKMLVAISFQESRFNPNAVGRGGSFGLMQFMPEIGRIYGVNPSSTPKEQIDAAMVFLNKIYLLWNDIPNTDQRIKFTLASYNAGRCHIQDAQKLAVLEGLNPCLWDGNVELMIKKLSDQAIYRSPYIRCGVYRGGAVPYVRIIYSKYQSWR